MQCKLAVVNMANQARKPVSVLSPLRYPGSKRRLAPYIAELIKLNQLKLKLLIEPFVGGGSVFLQLLAAGLVEKVVIGDADGRVASFWKVVFWDTEWLINQVHKIPVTVRKWHYFHKNQFQTDRELWHAYS